MVDICALCGYLQHHLRLVWEITMPGRNCHCTLVPFCTCLASCNSVFSAVCHPRSSHWIKRQAVLILILSLSWCSLQFSFRSLLGSKAESTASIVSSWSSVKPLSRKRASRWIGETQNSPKTAEISTVSLICFGISCGLYVGTELRVLRVLPTQRESISDHWVSEPWEGHPFRNGVTGVTDPKLGKVWCSACSVAWASLAGLQCLQALACWVLEKVVFRNCKCTIQHDSIHKITCYIEVHILYSVPEKLGGPTAKINHNFLNSAKQNVLLQVLQAVSYRLVVSFHISWIFLIFKGGNCCVGAGGRSNWHCNWQRKLISYCSICSYFQVFKDGMTSQIEGKAVAPAQKEVSVTHPSLWL